MSEIEDESEIADEGAADWIELVLEIDGWRLDNMADEVLRFCRCRPASC